ncbi:MAG: DUF4365 domain-containing protein [Nitrospiraceae bacterium]|nr:DUF4365 domain-containing protein [Nitrospira sp.]MCB9772704.1 DUF4365 domain-containing protein [Nitrospiraceae bacterium]
MTFPKRSKSHYFETDSYRILFEALPRKWLCRKIDERDYGIDCLIEMVGENQLVTGHVAAVQLKAMERPKWSGGSRQDLTDWFRSRPIKKQTVNYWMGLQQPVFLCIAEISTGKVFFVSVKPAIRSNYGLFRKNKAFAFRLSRLCDLTNPLGQDIFEQSYYRERGYDRFIERLFDIVAHQDQYFKLFKKAVVPTRELTFTPQDWIVCGSLVQTCLIILEYTSYAVERDRLNRHMNSLPKVSARSKSKQAQMVFVSLLRELYPAYGMCLKAAKNYVTKHEAEYWIVEEINFYRICSSLLKMNLPRLNFH